MIDINNITIGSDPEFPALNAEGTPQSVVGYIPGTKSQPFDLDAEGKYSIQHDNVGVETCIPPSRMAEEFVRHMMTSRNLAQQKLQQTRPDLSLASLSSCRYSAHELDSHEARTFGCDPSWCAYTEEVSPRPSPEQVGNLRSFGFHIHIGFKLTDENESAIEYALKIIKAMDIMCGVPSLFLDDDQDRRSIYGNPGDFRFRQIDDVTVVEYRSLGAAMHRSEELIEWVFNQTMKAVELANNWNEEIIAKSTLVEHTISTANLKLAQTIIDNFNIQIPSNEVRIRETIVA